MLVEIFGYAGDCTISGRLDMAGGRLTDLLEGASDVVVLDARLHGLGGEPVERVERLKLGRADLFAVEAGGPAGSDARRIHTVRHLVRFACGRYTIIGELHALPGARPLATLLAHRTMVPLTDCHVIYERDGEEEVRRAAVVIVNGLRIDTAEQIGLDDPDLERLALLRTT